MRTVCIIQQRLGSTRLKNKALLPLCGIPMTQHIVDRCKRAKLVDEVVVACPFKDAEILGAALDAIIVAPDVPENDLIGRYYTVAAGMKADLIVRISGDNPCIEPSEIYKLCGLVGGYLDGLIMTSEYLDREIPQSGFDGFGGERYTLTMLEWMDRTIKAPDYREHPHKFWRDIRRAFYIGKTYPPGFRLDINTQADYEKIRDIYEALYPKNHEFGIREILEYLDGKEA
ncbi:MAG TPA: NTP transferase domain-containing protein [Candidatus Paceibacterota bacterium]|nr:NTP transferase domain-containing protein [Candidatus Paceibacterota bacterium]